jgi:hypothetical protein
MRLLPAFIAVILVFLGGSVFLLQRGGSLNNAALRINGWMRKGRLQRTVILLLLFFLVLFLLRVMGKIALLIGGILFLIYLLSFQRR